MHFESLRGKQLLDIHSLLPQNLREKNERCIILNLERANPQFTGETIEQNFKELREQLHQFNLDQQRAQVEHEQRIQARMQMQNLDTDRTNKSGSAFHNSKQPSKTTSMDISKKRFSMTTKSSQQRRKLTTVEQGKKIIAQGLANRLMKKPEKSSSTMSAHPQSIDTLSQPKKRFSVCTPTVSDVDFTNQMKNSDQTSSQPVLLQRLQTNLLRKPSQIQSQNTLTTQKENNGMLTIQETIAALQRAKFEQQQKASINTAYDSQASRKSSILHKHTIKVLRPSTSRFSMTKHKASIFSFKSKESLKLDEQIQSGSGQPTFQIRDIQTPKAININQNIFKTEDNRKLTIQKSHQIIPTARVGFTPTNYANPKEIKTSISPKSHLQTMSNQRRSYFSSGSQTTQDEEYQYVPKQVYFRYTKRPKFKGNEPIPAIYESGCLTCGKTNMIVQFHGQRHVCFNCRKYLLTPDGLPIILISTPDGQIIAFIKKLRLNKGSGQNDEDKHERRFSFVMVDHNDMRIFDRKCYATFAGEGELVVLLKD